MLAVVLRRMYVVFLVLASANSLRCAHTEDQERGRVVDTAPQSDTALYGAQLHPVLVSKLKAERDESGTFVQIDDMRFRTIEIFGFSGRDWPNGQLVYELSPDVRNNAFRTAQFLTACNTLLRDAGIKCVERSNARDRRNYVFVLNDSSNYSYVGRVGGRQELGIFNWQNAFIIGHEIKHALGWQHEHQRRDRDKFVRIRLENVEGEKEHNFTVEPKTSAVSAYDFGSVMHYEPTAFSKNGQRTIEPRPEFSAQLQFMGQRERFSDTDTTELTHIYGEFGTEWCGFDRMPVLIPESGCLAECMFDPNDPDSGRWLVCGCRPHPMCP
jgi:hypothetical protein